MRERDLDDLDPEERGVRVLGGCRAHAPGELARRPHAGRTGHVDVHVVGVLGIHQQRVRVRAAAGLHVSDVLGVRDVRDVKDADAADSLTTHRVLDTLRTAVEACAVGFAGYEQQVLVYRDVALGCGADVAGFQHR